MAQSRPFSFTPEFFNTDPKRLSARDWQFIAVCAVIALASLAIALRYFYVAFPEASIDFRVSRLESRPIAEKFFESRGLSTSGYLHSARFAYDDEAKTFMERELGLPATQRLVATRVHLWRWENRWFRPLQKEELLAAVTPVGDLVGFDHEIDEAAPGASLSESAARAGAEQFLTTVMHLDLAQLEFVSSDSLQRPKRVDYSFIWKDKQPLATGSKSRYVADASYRRQVRVQGNEIGQYREFVYVPEAWSRAYEQMRSKNNTTGLVDSILFICVLGLALLAIVVLRIRRRDVRWRAAVLVGIAGAVLTFLASLNAFPLAVFGYSTTQSYSAFVARQIFSAILSGVGAGVFFTLLTAGAEAVYRERFPSKLGIPSFLTWRGIRTKSFFLSVILGIALAFFFFAYQTVFYLFANWLGAWAPAEVPYDDILSTRLPWLFVLLGGFAPAIFEEFAFRAFAIPVFERWFRSLWIAVIGAAFLWGFGHAAYPNQPFYIRGVEVGLGGIILSWVMIRFNVLTTVVWHYTVDAIYTALLLVRSHNAYLRGSGILTAFIAAIPLLFAAVAYWRSGTFAAPAGLTNIDLGTAPELPKEREPLAAELPLYQRVPRTRWVIGFAIGLLLALGFALKGGDWRPKTRFTSTPPDAKASGLAFLSSQRIDAHSYRQTAVATSNVDGTAAHFLFKTGGEKAVVDEYSGPLVPAQWDVRFFRELQKEEFDLAFAPDGRTLSGYQHQVEDTAPGASLATAEAQNRAEAFLRARGLDPANFVLKASHTEKRKARADSNFTWEAKPGSPFNRGDVRLRVDVGVLGDSVGNYRPYLYVPEEKVRAYQQTALGDVLLTVLRYLTFAGFAGLLIWAFVRAIQTGAMKWRPVLMLGALAAGLLAVSFLFRLPLIFQRYPTDQPWSAFLVAITGSVVFSAVLVFVGAIWLLGALISNVPEGLAALTPAARSVWGRDAALTSILALLWFGGSDQWRTFISSHLIRPGWPNLPSVPDLTAMPPGAADLISAILFGSAIALVIGALAPIVVRAWRSKGQAVVILGFVALWLATLPRTHTRAEFFLALALGLGNWIIFVVFVGCFLRNNPLAYLSAAVISVLVGSAVALVSESAALYRIGGGVLLLIGLGWLLWIGLSPAEQPPEYAYVGAYVRQPPSSLSGSEQP